MLMGWDGMRERKEGEERHLRWTWTLCITTWTEHIHDEMMRLRAEDVETHLH